MSATSRPCSGAEHLISHSLDAMLGTGAGLHGHQVALGSLVSAAAHDSPLLEVLQRLFLRLGLPTAPEDLGISPETLAEAIRRAPEVRPERFTVLSQLGREVPDADELVRRACWSASSVPATT